MFGVAGGGGVVTVLEFMVVGTPAPQGSKRHVGGGVMVESSKKVRPWRQDVRDAAKGALELHEGWPPGGKRTGYIVDFEFILHRPKATPKTHPGWTNTGPDVSKLSRATEDALTEAGVYPDDRCIFRERLDKRLAEPGEATGCRIRVEQVTW